MAVMVAPGVQVVGVAADRQRVRQRTVTMVLTVARLLAVLAERRRQAVARVALAAIPAMTVWLAARLVVAAVERARQAMERTLLLDR